MENTGLPPRIRSILRSESMAGHTQHMNEIKTNVANSNNLVRHSMARQMDEASPQQAAAIKKILALPG